VRDGYEEPLPDWDDWGGDLVRGFKMWLIQIIWALPLILFSMPVAIGAAIADTGSAGEFIGVSLMLCAGCLALLYGLFVALAAPGYTISFAHDESIGKGLALTAMGSQTPKPERGRRPRTHSRRLRGRESLGSPPGRDSS
jgi:hypothetical protein